jgi:subtilisin family serine protease
MGSTRRHFLAVCGTILGGVTASHSVRGAETSDRFIVDTTNLPEGTLNQPNLDIVYRFPAVDVTVVEGSRETLQRMTSEFATDIRLSSNPPTVQAIDESATDEPLYPLQWDKQALSIPTAQETTGGADSRVTVIDTGVDPDHPDLKRAVNDTLSRNFVSDRGPDDFTDSGFHGTFVSGIIAADDRNEAGIVGVAPDTDLVALRVFPGTVDKGASFADILAALDYSVEIDADAANLSLGAYPVPLSDPDTAEFYSNVLTRMFLRAYRKGTLPVVAAGNDGANLDTDGSKLALPAQVPGSFAVSATGPIGFDPETGTFNEPPHRPASYTNYGLSVVDIAAPGGSVAEGATRFDLVPSTFPGGDYGLSAGTSFAAPQVSGTVALLAAVDALSEARAPRIANALSQTADVPNEYDRQFYGSGFLNPVEALRTFERLKVSA